MAHHHDNSFWIEVCPFEGGSDHDIFLAMDIPALLTWHYTDYRYHTSFNTLYMASPAEMENVSLTTLATSLMMSDTCDDESAAAELLDALKQAAMNQMDAEMVNTEYHLSFVQAGHATYEDALANEKEVLNAWRG